MSDRHALTKATPTSLHMRVHVGLAHDLPIMGSYLLVPGTSIKQAVDDDDAKLPLDFRVWDTIDMSDTECVASALLSCSALCSLKVRFQQVFRQHQGLERQTSTNCSYNSICYKCQMIRTTFAHELDEIGLQKVFTTTLWAI